MKHGLDCYIAVAIDQDNFTHQLGVYEWSLTRGLLAAKERIQQVMDNHKDFEAERECPPLVEARVIECHYGEKFILNTSITAEEITKKKRSAAAEKAARKRKRAAREAEKKPARKKRKLVKA